MKSKIVLTALIIGAAWLISCSKEDIDNGPSDHPLISTITSGDSTYPFTLELQYDSDHRLISYGFGDTAVLSFTYGNNTVTRKIYSYPGHVMATDVYTLNDKGQAVTCVSRYEPNTELIPSFPFPGGLTGDSTVTLYEYDESGYMVRMVMMVGSFDTTTTTYTIFNGNVISETMDNGNMSSTYTYDYFTDKVNTIGNQNTGLYFLGKQSANLVRSISATSLLQSYTYEFDGAGRVQKQTASTGQSYFFTYKD